MRTFVGQFVDDLVIGPNNNQIGIITFSDDARVEFTLSTHNDSASLGQAISSINYFGGSTNIPNALCQLITSYNDSTFGARSVADVFRVAILMTDGQSNRNRNPCGFQTVSEAAAALHATIPPIVVFAFGVGDDYDPRDVREIASRPELVSFAQSFGVSQLECVQATQEDDICFSSKCS